MHVRAEWLRERRSEAGEVGELEACAWGHCGVAVLSLSELGVRGCKMCFVVVVVHGTADVAVNGEVDVYEEKSN